MDNKKKRLIRDYCYMIIGSLLISIASKNIYDPAGLIIGGVSGISIILRHLFGLPLLSIFPFLLWDISLRDGNSLPELYLLPCFVPLFCMYFRITL